MLSKSSRSLLRSFSHYYHPQQHSITTTATTTLRFYCSAASNASRSAVLCRSSVLINSNQVFAYAASSSSLQLRSYAKNDKNNKKGGKSSGGGDEEGETVPLKFDRKDFESKMTKHIELFKNELTTVRTGRANPQLLENIKIKLDDGSSPPLKSLGAIVVKNARLLSINVFDQKNVMLIMKSVREEELGFNPQAKANVIDVPVPKMTMEIRESVVKMMKRNAENAKERIRGVRRDGMNAIKKIKNAPKDDVFKLEKEMQIVTDEYIKKIDDLLAAKEKEILQNSQ